ncbi:MAG TPA: PQQ-dependent sugar dehydrogenase [Planctomycetaceae bacterium]|nr:PQQ-dependent sugar dehydrogenase [Planctomycetaceae bacterium]
MSFSPVRGLRASTAASAVVLAVLFVFTSLDAAAPDTPPRKPTGIQARVPWTTSRIHGTPEPPMPYTTEVAFPRLVFHEPLSVARVPATGQFLVAQRDGKVYAFDNDRQTEARRLVLDVGRTTYGITVHPAFGDNGFLYVTYLVDGSESPTGSRLSRFTVDRRSMRAAPDSEQIVLVWPSGGHNGGCLRFGPDGFLYLATGDASGIADGLLTGQDLSDLPGSILRIDVDRPSEGNAYGIPRDNPFVDTPGARPEIYSYGHRQPWKFSFSPEGHLFAGEVGQDLWEMICLIEKGGNYGWSVMEGTHPFRPERPRGPTPILKPLVEHPHSDFRSITGGYVSTTPRLPDLRGHYIYGDYDTGAVWAFRFQPDRQPARSSDDERAAAPSAGPYVDSRITDHRRLCDTQIRLVDFGLDASGDVLLVDFAGGQLHRLVSAPSRPAAAHEFPVRLSDTGLFSSTGDHTPAPGVIPYTVNAPLWSDGAEKDRFLALPGTSQIEFNVVTYPQPAPGAAPGWRFPDGTVLVKTFSLEMEAGHPDSRRRLETRLLHHERMPGNDDEYGAQVWHGYTYVWNDEQTDAFLLESGGLDRTFTVRDPTAPGGKRDQTWHFPSRAECTLCHTMAAKYVLGVNTLQFNRDHVYHTQTGPVVANQLATLAHLGMFTKPLPSPPEELPRLVDYHDPGAPLGARARSYLHANCAHCHRKWGGGNAEFQLLADLPLDETGTIGVRPGQGDFGLANAALLVPGEPERSLIYHRATFRGLGQMPHVASNVVDAEAVTLVGEWIRGMQTTAPPRMPRGN